MCLFDFSVGSSLFIRMDGCTWPVNIHGWIHGWFHQPGKSLGHVSLEQIFYHKNFNGKPGGGGGDITPAKQKVRNSVRVCARLPLGLEFCN